MTTLTRCPHCQTAFRITTEQLLARQGQVRCGNCAEVFNALDHLVPPAPAAAVVPVDDASPAVESPNFELFGAPNDAAAASGEVEPAAPGAPPQHPGSLLAPRPPAARRSAIWPYAIGAAVAVLVLAGQAGWHFRNQVAAQFPQTRPWLDALCAQAGCTIAPPIDAQAISIESSDLQADPGNRAILVLSAVLRNRAPFAQPAPLLELSLTDAGDVPLARRVLRPADYATETAAIGAGAELQLRLVVDSGQLRASGYRLYAFYP
ncbi:MAG: DUF3426 domain-containing protein [Burkholderiales bacterium]|nr:DUF3426 domain-containing protein [Burkholderiales bacterium]